MSLEPPPEPARSRRQWLDRHPLTARVLLVGALAGATAVLVVMAKLAAFSTSAGHAYGMGLAAGLGWAAGLRYGPTMLFGLALGGIGGMLYAGAGPMLATTATALACTSLAVSARLLRHTAFDWRMERARDVAWLAAAAAGWAALNALLLTVLAAFPARGLPLGAQGVAWLWAQGVVCFLIGALPALTLDRRALPLLGHRSRMLALLLLSVAAGASAVAPFLANPMTGGTWSWLWFVPQVLLAVMVIVGGTAPAASTLLIVSLTLSWAGHQPGVLGGYESLVSELHVAGAVSSMLAIVLLQHALVAESSWREQRWEWALDGSRLGVADWHLQRPDSFVSTAWRALTGAPPGHWRSDQWVDHTHPDDRKLLEHALAQVSRGEVGRMRVDLRMPHLNGWRWLEATLLVIERDMSGTPVRLLATVADVHDRHEAQHQQRLSASLFQHLHEGLLITDAELRVLDANPAYTDILGVTRAEMLGSVPSLLRPSPADPLARQQRAAMWSALRQSGAWRGELFERRRSGEICTLQVTISPVLGPAEDRRYHVLVISDITEQRAQRERLERQAHFDELTRLPNRAYLSQLLADAMRSTDRDGYLLTVCYLDLDHFKPVNDRFGHAAGDRLLTELAGRLRSALRTRETWADTAARLGGDEFVLLLRAGTIEEARMAVERVLRVVSQPYVVDPAAEPVQITASMGATVYPIDRSDADTLLRHADHAMYGAKQSGRNGYLFFDPEHRRRTEERVMAIGRVQEALDSGEFVLHYQPKVDMRSGRVLGLEALLRWEHPQQGLIAPMQFLPLIENTGLSSRVGDWVFAQALEHLSQWRRNGLDISVSVNVSARHLQEPDFALRLSELLARHNESLAAHFELEVLETAAHADIEATSALLARCQALGVRFALDDFGTGYSTLTYLKRLPVDVLKIDRSFVHHMLDDEQDRAIVEGVIGLAGTFGCTVVAEGVESPAQARMLLDLGCDIGQGTGIAAPMPAGQVVQWVAAYKGVFALAPAGGAMVFPAAAGVLDAPPAG